MQSVYRQSEITALFPFDSLLDKGNTFQKNFNGKQFFKNKEDRTLQDFKIKNYSYRLYFCSTWSVYPWCLINVLNTHFLPDETFWNILNPALLISLILSFHISSHEWICDSSMCKLVQRSWTDSSIALLMFKIFTASLCIVFVIVFIGSFITDKIQMFLLPGDNYRLPEDKENTVLPFTICNHPRKNAKGLAYRSSSSASATFSKWTCILWPWGASSCQWQVRLLL